MGFLHELFKTKREETQGLYLNLRKNLAVTIGIRLIIGLALLSSAGFLLRFRNEEEFSDAIFRFLLVIFVLTLIYAFLLERLRDLARFAYVQLFIDVILLTVIVFATGGFISIYSVSYIGLIIVANILLDIRGGIRVALLSIVCFSIMVILQFLGKIKPPPFLIKAEYIIDLQSLIYTISSTILGFLATAYLSGYLTDRYKRTFFELQEKKRRLEEFQNFNQEVLLSILNGLIIVDPEGKITYMNKSAETICGVSLEAMLGKPIKEVFGPKYAYELMDILFKDLKEPRRYEDWFEFSGKGRIYLELTASIHRGLDGDAKGVVIFFSDLTEKKSYELRMLRSEQLAAVGEMAAGIAHEIRNPLGAISGSLELLKSDLVLNQTNEKLMNIILNETKRLNKLVDNFLNFARPAPLKKEMTDLNSLIDEVRILLVSQKDFNPKISFNLNFQEKSLMANIDPNQIRQVIWNICLNALEAMPDAGLLTITTKYVSFDEIPEHHLSKPLPTEKTNRKFVAISISDTGIGMDSEAINMVFKPFFSRKSGGVGIGLATANRLVEEHGGFIAVESELNIGSTFTIYLPV